MTESLISAPARAQPLSHEYPAIPSRFPLGLVGKMIAKNVIVCEKGVKTRKKREESQDPKKKRLRNIVKSDSRIYVRPTQFHVFSYKTLPAPTL